MDTIGTRHLKKTAVVVVGVVAVMVVVVAAVVVVTVVVTVVPFVTVVMISWAWHITYFEIINKQQCI